MRVRNSIPCIQNRRLTIACRGFEYDQTFMVSATLRSSISSSVHDGSLLSQFGQTSRIVSNRYTACDLSLANSSLKVRCFSFGVRETWTTDLLFLGGSSVFSRIYFSTIFVTSLDQLYLFTSSACSHSMVLDIVLGVHVSVDKAPTAHADKPICAYLIGINEKGNRTSAPMTRTNLRPNR